MQHSRGAPSYGRATLLSLLALALPASAAEREHTGPHAVTVYLDGYREDRPNIYTISESYEDYGSCKEAIKRVRVLVKGGRLQCDAVETRRVN